MTTQREMSAQTELAALLESVIRGVIDSAGAECEYWEAAGAAIAEGWGKARVVKFSQLGSLPFGVIIRNKESGTIAVRESEKDWFIPGLDYEIELWELENPEGEDFTILFTPDVQP